jgi:hypothetical protein
MDFKGVSNVLEKYGGQITDSIRQKLRQDNTYASGDAYNSVSYKVVRDNELEIYYSSVVDVIDKGLAKERVYPSITSIVKWMEDKNIQPRNLKTGRFVKKTRTYMRRTAFALRWAIVNKGTIERKNYRGTGVLDFAFSKDRIQKMTDELSSMFGNEVNEQILLTLTSNGFTRK